MDNTHQQQPAQQDSLSPRFESDTQKLVRLHLQDRNHVITEEEIRAVRIGMFPNEELAAAEKARMNMVDPASNPVSLPTISTP